MHTENKSLLQISLFEDGMNMKTVSINSIEYNMNQIENIIKFTTYEIELNLYNNELLIAM